MSYYYSQGYAGILKDFGEILVQEDEPGYQGDSLVLFRDMSEYDRYGFLCFGWGSCSGCDALEAVKSFAELQKLRQELYDSVIWGSREEILKLLKDKFEQRTDFYFHSYGDKDEPIPKFVDTFYKASFEFLEKN